eukprot:TRINITY_DN2034_c0_g1_i1.p1 TRINITY_DN2034_c0_g1~~TRINITY_DN2034_c0_g1_i1.p1  ORF type:complete len:197 (-),score=32.45 TRINITY_DN2034_c0_g1_i1:312-902(-)
MTLVATKGDFSILVITPELVDECAEVCTISFLKSEVMCRCTKPPREHWKGVAKFLVETSLETNVSLCVRDERKGNIVSICTVVDYTSPVPEEVQTHESLVHIFTFVDKFQDFFISGFRKEMGKKIVYGDVAHIFLNATLPEYEGNGFTKWQLENLFGLAKKRGYKSCVAELTSPGTQHIYPKFEFEELGRVYYKTF